MSAPQEVALTQGRSAAEVVRNGDVVHRTCGPRAAFAHAVLRHLEQRGFAGAPRVLGLDARGREMLTFMHGEVPHRDVAWTDAQLVAVARLVRGLHDATAGTPLAGDQEVVCHRDLSPWNVVLADGVPVAFIDFDGVRPGRRSEDIGYVLWVSLDLGDSHDSACEQARRMRLRCDAYGPLDPAEVVSAIEEQQRLVLAMRDAQAATATDPQTRAWAVARVADIRARPPGQWSTARCCSRG